MKITPREERRHAAGREKYEDMICSELHTPKSVGREGSKGWALSVVPHFSLSPPRLAFLAWSDFHARSTIPEEKWGTTRSLAETRIENTQILCKGLLSVLL